MLVAIGAHLPQMFLHFCTDDIFPQRYIEEETALSLLKYNENDNIVASSTPMYRHKVETLNALLTVVHYENGKKDLHLYCHKVVEIVDLKRF